RKRAARLRAAPVPCAPRGFSRLRGRAEQSRSTPCPLPLRLQRIPITPPIQGRERPAVLAEYSHNVSAVLSRMVDGLHERDEDGQAVRIAVELAGEHVAGVALGGSLDEALAAAAGVRAENVNAGELRVLAQHLLRRAAGDGPVVALFSAAQVPQRVAHVAVGA